MLKSKTIIGTNYQHKYRREVLQTSEEKETVRLDYPTVTIRAEIIAE